MLQRALWRFLRGALAAGAGAAIVWGAGHAHELPLDPALTALIAAVLLAADKYLRDAGVYGGSRASL